MTGPFKGSEPRLSPHSTAFDITVVAGVASSLVAIACGRAAWYRWLRPGDDPTIFGVVLSVILTLLSAVVGIYLATRWGY